MGRLAQWRLAQLECFVIQFVDNHNYEVLQVLLDSSELTPQLFRDFKIFGNGLGISKTQAKWIDIKWLFDNIFPRPEDRDSGLILYIVRCGLLEEALKLGLTVKEIPPTVWLVALKPYDVQPLVLNKLLELKVPFPEGIEDNMSKLFIWTSLFKKLVTEISSFKFSSHYLNILVGKLHYYAHEENLNILFQVGFTREHLCSSQLWNKIVSRGLQLIDDWIAQDVGLPQDVGQVRSCVTHRYWQKVATYLMSRSLREQRGKDYINHTDIWQSKKLIQLSIKLGFMSIEEWELLASRDKNPFPSCYTVNIREALKSLSRERSRPDLDYGC
jgi:hypothetical protein